MLVGIYSDLHCSSMSSIMPLHTEESNIYTTRLNMIVKTGKWMYEEFAKRGVELILNGGDTFDKNFVKAEEITALTEFYSYSKGTKEIAILGNHEILDVSRNFSTVAFLNNYDFINLYSKPCKVNDMISVLPHMNSDDISNDMLKKISNEILISHIDIKGSVLRGTYIMDTGVSPEILAEYFGITINGHLHTPEIIKTSKNKVINIGSVSSSSFNDSNTYIPSICIYDTDTREIERIDNPHSILFRRISASNVSDLISKLDRFSNSSNHKFIYRVTIPYEFRKDARDVLSSRKEALSYRVVTEVTGSKLTGESLFLNTINSSNDIRSEFIKFIEENSDSLNHPVNKYLQIIEEMEV